MESRFVSSDLGFDVIALRMTSKLCGRKSDYNRTLKQGWLHRD